MLISSLAKVLLAALLILGVPHVTVAQAIREWQGQVIGTVLAARFLGAGLGFGVRSPGRLRVGASLSAGDREGVLATRVEVMASYHLDPLKRRGVTPYLGGGVAIAATRGRIDEFLLAVVGIETSPGGRLGWFLEGGVGGGIRFSAGARVRGSRIGR